MTIKFCVIYAAKLDAENGSESFVMWFKDFHHEGDPIFVHRESYAQKFSSREEAEGMRRELQFRYRRYQHLQHIVETLTVLPVEAA